MDFLAEFNQMMTEKGRDLKAVLLAYRDRGRKLYEIRCAPFTNLFHSFDPLGTYTVGARDIRLFMDKNTHDFYFEEVSKTKTA